MCILSILLLRCGVGDYNLLSGCVGGGRVVYRSVQLAMDIMQCSKEGVIGC